jgi:flavodoxin
MGARKALLICVSVSHGNTAAVARAMAEVLDAEIREPEEVDPQTLDDFDVVGFGSGMFYGSHHRRLREYVEQLPMARDTRAFVFATAGTGRLQSRPWQSSLEGVLAEKGYDVVGSFVCPGFDTWLPLNLVGGINKGRPNARDLTRARGFAERIDTQVPVT